MSTPSTQTAQTAQRPMKGLPMQIIAGAVALALVVGVVTWMRNPQVTELPKQPPSPAIVPAPPGSPRFKIAFANLTEDGPYQVRVREGIEKAAKTMGNIDIVTADNKLSGEQALINVNNFLIQKVDAVIEYQTDEKFGRVIMSKLNEKKIPVIAIDIPMPGAPYFGVNNPIAGLVAGDRLGQWISRNWGGKVDALIMLELPQSGPVPAQRMEGMRAGLEAIVGLLPESKVRHLDSKNTLEEARRLVTDTLTTLPGKHHIAIVCINDDTAAGAIAAAEAVGRKKDIAVVGVDASERGRAEIRKPNSPMVGSTASFPEKYGEKVLPAMVKMLEGEKVPPKIYIDHVFIDKKNVDKFYPNEKK
jgi:ribose transport system substrate-binding protein